MLIFLNNIKSALVDKTITQDQAMYLIYLNSEVPYDIEATAYLELVRLKYVVNNRIGKKLYESENVREKLKGTIKAQYINDISNQAVRRLYTMFCMQDPKTGKLRLPGAEKSENPVEEMADHYLRGEGLVGYHFAIFLYMFPIRGPYNRKWEKHFTSKEYDGAHIRKRSKANGEMFLKIIKKKDMGAFLYGTYLYVASTIQGDRTYVTTIPKYLKEYDEWYFVALETIKAAKSVDDLFKKRVLSKEGRVGLSI